MGAQSIRVAVCALAGISFLGPAAAQPPLPTYIPQTRFDTGQDVVPVYEGWERNPDGPDNKIEPGEPERGQPTYFLPRRQKWVFRVQVPKDWGQKELVWTIASHGKTEKAYATLQLEEEILERLIMTNGNLNPGEDDP